MLSEHDRQALRAIERRLLAEDAAFGRQFVADPRRHRPTRPTGRGAAQFAGMLLLGMLMFLAGSTAGMVAFFGAAAAIGLAWWYVRTPDRAEP
jgi:membrane associated rhomboid family serine protease